MSLTKVSYSMIQGDVINVFDYMTEAQIADITSNTGAIAVDVAVQAGIDASLAQKKILRLPAGVYRLEKTLNISSTNWLLGDGKDSTKLYCRHSSSCILASGWGGKIQGLGIYTFYDSSHGIQAGNNSRNCSIQDVYLDATAVGASCTAYGIYLYDNQGFSGGIEISTSYAIQFLCGIFMDGLNVNTNTWTTVSIYNFWTVGYPGPRAGSRGVYMSNRCNGIGTCMYGGTIEQFEYGIYVDDNSFGGVFNTDLEGNTYNSYLGDTFSGAINSAFGSSISRYRNGKAGVIWNNVDLTSGFGPRQENYYTPFYMVYTGDGAPQAIYFYRNAASITAGGALDANRVKFAIGMGQNGVNGIDTDPNNHYIEIGNRSIHFDSQSPATTGGKAWTKGSICYNSNATVGQPTGWMCTVAGTPGTWVAMANL
jgi:hypothetical protein